MVVCVQHSVCLPSRRILNHGRTEAPTAIAGLVSRQFTPGFRAPGIPGESQPGKLNSPQTIVASSLRKRSTGLECISG